MGWSRFWRRRQRDAELAEELESYVAHETGQRVNEGAAADEARHAALRKLGNPTRVRETVYEMNSLAPVEALAKDLRYAARLLRRSPGFAIAAILSLALGIGANTAIFQLLDALRLRSLPIPRPHELVEVVVDGGNRGYGVSDSSNANLTNPLWEGLRDTQQAFAGLFVWGNAGLPVGRGRDLQFPRSIWVSGDFFPVLGLVPVRGRLLGRADDIRGCAPGGVVISHAYWQRAFGGRDAAIGAPLVIGDKVFQVAGVTPPEFFGLEVGQRFDIALPVCAAGLWGTALDQKHSWWLTAMGRLKPGWTPSQAAEHVKVLSVQLFDLNAPTGYGDNSNWKALRFTAIPAGKGISQWRQQYETSLWLLLGITGLVLLVACANLANLMLARATARQREFALRLALGASRWRLASQSLTESLLIAIVGATLGVALADALSRTVVVFLTTKANGLHLDLALDWRVLAFTSGLAILTCLICGLAPALRSTRSEPAEVMKSGGRGLTGGPERFSFQRVLVVSQVAVSLVLVIGALLFVRSFRNLLTTDAGFRQDGLHYVFAFLPRPNLSPEQLIQAREALLDRFRALPQIDAAASASKVPLTSSSWTMGIRVGSTGLDAKQSSKVTWVSPEYFRTVDIPLISGRDVGRADTASSRKVMVVNQTFVQRYLGGQHAVGTFVRTGEEPGYPEAVYEIVGTVGDAKYSDLREEIPPIAYVPESQFPTPRGGMNLIFRTSAPTDTVAASVRRLLQEENVISGDVEVLRQHVRERLTRERLLSWLSGFFGVLAGLLAAIGLYGVMSYAVARRSSEIAIRMALGAARNDILRMMLGQAGRLLVIGLVIGVVLALAVGRTAGTLLFGLQPTDPLTFLASALALALVALAAAYLPAARATRVSPLDGLRAE
jgi:predicted permease